MNKKEVLKDAMTEYDIENKTNEEFFSVNDNVVNNNSNKKSINKKRVNFYIENEIIEDSKILARIEGDSFNKFVENLLKNAIIENSQRIKKFKNI